MMLMLSVLAWLLVCLAASACMSACSVWGWPLEPDLLAASGWCAPRFHGRQKKERERETGMRAIVCDCVHVCVMCSEANWSRVSRMHTRLMAWLQPCDTKYLVLVCLSARTQATVTLCACVEMMHQWLSFSCQVCCVCVHVYMCMFYVSKCDCDLEEQQD